MSDWEDYGGDYSDPGSTVVDWFDNGDGSWTNLADGTIWENDQVIGYDFGDGTWMDLDGNIRGADNQLLPGFDASFEYDEASGFWFDTLTGAWINEAGEVVSFGGDAPSFPDSLPGGPDTSGDYTPNQGGGFWQSVGDFLGKIFGGGSGAPGGGGGGFGGGGSFGGGSSGAQQQAQQRAQQAAQQLARAQQQGASAQQIAQLQQQLALSQAVLSRMGGSNVGQTILIAAAVGVGVYALATSRRDSTPANR